ncbi:MAG: putative Ig domain-containing protein [Eubacteriales bacterium]|nr:putative Ig domain-containing protein [Eubacteriales bacterium]
MMKKRLLSLLICLCMLLPLVPQTASAAINYTAVYSGKTYSALTLSSGSYLLENCTINGGDNTAGITLTAGSIVDLYIKGTVTINGGNSTAGTYGGAPGIYVPEGTALRLWDISGTKADLRVYGGKGADAKPGTTGLYMRPTEFHDDMITVDGETYDGGVGGWGASGGGAAIGTFGGTGGRGGGRSGKVLRASGGNGTTAAAMGYVSIFYKNSSSRLTVKGGSGGAAAKGGYGGVGNAAQSVMKKVVASGSGGGGGGGNGSQGADVGTGGGGGGGGGMGGMALTNKGFWASMSGAGGGGAGQGVTQSGGGGGGGDMMIQLIDGTISAHTYKGDLSRNNPTGSPVDCPAELRALGIDQEYMIQLVPGKPGQDGNAKSNADSDYRIVLNGAKTHYAYSGEGGKANGTGGQAGLSSDGDDFRSKSGGNGGAAGAGATSYRVITYDFCDDNSLFTSYNTTGSTVGTNIPANPTRKGYVFGGWYTGKDGTGNKVTVDTKISSVLTTFYANWLMAPKNFFVGTPSFIQDVSYNSSNSIYHMLVEGTTPMTWSLAEGHLPDGMTLATNADGTDVYFTGTPTQKGEYTVKFAITNNAGTLTTEQVIIRVTAPMENRPPVYIETSEQNPFRVGAKTTCSFTARADSGTSYRYPEAPCWWEVLDASTMPDGLTLTYDTTKDDNTRIATLSGVPTQAGEYPVRLKVSNAYGSCEQEITIVVLEAAEPVKILTEALPDAVQNEAYNAEILYAGTNESAAYGVINVTYECNGETKRLPAGMMSDSPTLRADGYSVSTISASLNAPVTAAPGTYNIKWTAYHLKNSDEYSDSNTKQFTLTVRAATEKPAFTTITLPSAVGGTAYTEQLFASGGNVAYALTEGRLPVGMTLSASGILSGTPTESGDFPITVTATNTAGTTEQQLTLQVAPDPAWVTISTKTLPDGNEGAPYSQQLSATTGSGAIIWSTTNLPTGIALSQTGLLSGTPTVSGDFYFTVTADNGTNNATQNLQLHIEHKPVSPAITTKSLAGGTVGAPYSETLTATGDAPITWSVTQGALPQGLTLDANTGVISGTPTVAGIGTFTITADNGIAPNNASETALMSKPFTITIAPAPVAPTITTETLNGGTVGEAYSQTLTADGDAPLTWRLYSGTMPDGLTLATDGTLSGTPTQAGASSVTFIVSNQSGADMRMLALNIGAKGAPKITFTKQPAQYTTAAVGNITASLTAEAAVLPSAAVTLSWYSCDENGISNGNVLATGTSFTLPTDLEAGVYYYLCEAVSSGAVSVLSNVATVIVGKASTVKLDTPTGLVWESAISAKAKWTAVDNASGYSVALYKDGALYGSARFVNGTECDFTDTIKDTGSYNFKVTAMGNGKEYANSAESLESAAYSYTKSNGSIILYSDRDLSGTGWEWDHTTRILTLNGATVENVSMTGSDPVTINVVSDSTITGVLSCVEHGPNIKYVVTSTTGATLTVREINGSGNNNDSVTVTNGAKVNAQTAYWGASGGADSYLSVIGTVSTTGADSTFTLNDSIYRQHYTVKDGATLNINGSMTIAAGGSLDLDKISHINLEDGLSIESAPTGDYSGLLPYLPDGYFFEYDDNSRAFVLMESASKPATKVEMYYRTPGVLKINFTIQPVANTAVVAGSITGSLTAAATVSNGGTAALNWYACDVNGTPSGNSLATGSTLSLPTYLPIGTYHYLCQASYTGAATVHSSVATVTVRTTPVANHLVTVSFGTGGGSYDEGTTVTLTADSPVTGMQFKQWEISPSVGFTEGGIATATVKFTMPAYAVIATATYEASFRIITQPAEQAVLVGEQATFSVVATGDGLKYQWYIDRKNGAWEALNDATLASYTTSAVNLSNDGFRYKCRINDSLGGWLETEAVALRVSEPSIPPKTGDSSQPLLWLSLCVMEMLSLMLIGRKQRRTK